MKKSSQIKIIFIFLIIIVIISAIAIFLILKEDQNQLEQTNITQEANQTTDNEITDNKTNFIPDPTGIITYIDRENNNGYYCNGSIDPEHKIKLHTYKLINQIKTLSNNYIESEKITNICRTYPDLNESLGLKYEIEWRWEGVEGIDGYRIYQDYESDKDDNIEREYDYFIETKATRLLDTGLDLWRRNETQGP